jgi:phosphate acetyltransferase
VARSVYIVGLDPSAGKSLVALGVAELISRRAGRLALYRPLAEPSDSLLQLLRRRYDAAGSCGVQPGAALELLSAGRGEELTGRIVEGYRAVAADAEAVVVIGGNLEIDAPAHRGLPYDPAFDANLATEFGAALIAVIDGRQAQPAELLERIRAAGHQLGPQLLATCVNRVSAERLDAVRAALSALDPPAYVIGEVPELTTPTVAEVAAALDAKQLAGDAAALARDVRGFVVGGATVPVFLDHLSDGALVIAPGDRADIIIAAFTAHAAGARH